MWTATLLRATRNHGRLDIEIAYSDGTDTINKSYNLENPTKKSIRALARNEASRLAKLASEVIDLPVGTTIDVTPDPVTPPPAPTPEEIAEGAWFKDWHKLQRLMRLANAGLIQPTDARIVTLQTSLKADWLNAYMAGI